MIDIPIGCKGEFNVILKNESGEITFETGFQDNLILDNFFTTVRTSSLGNNDSIKVGTGTTPPLPTQTSLVSFLARTTNVTEANNFSTDGTTWQLRYTLTATFTLGAVVGQVSELGLYFGAFEASDTSTVMTRALIKDGGGNPTTVTVTNQDQLIVIYRLTAQGSEADTTGSITLAGSNTTHTWLCRRASFSSMSLNKLLRGESGFSSGFPSTSSLGTVGTGITGSTGEVSVSCIVDLSVAKQVTWTLSCNTTSGNASGGLAYVAGFGAQHIKVQFTPPIPKDSTKTLSIIFRYTFDRI